VKYLSIYFTRVVCLLKAYPQVELLTHLLTYLLHGTESIFKK